MPRAKKSASRAAPLPKPLRRDEVLALVWAYAGARKQVRRIASSPQWLKAPLLQHVDAVLDELDEFHADADSYYLDLEAIDRLAAKVAMLREIVRRANGHP